MVEPLHPQLRRQLIRAHAGLSETDIDRLEELTSLRFTLDPERDAARLRDVDAERERLLREKMPLFSEVARAFAAQRARREAAAQPDVVVEQRELEQPERPRTDHNS